MRRRRRGRRVVTPDGHVWFVRRRRARRRPFWASRPPERYHGEDDLPDPDEQLPVPGVLDLFTYAEDDLGERGFDRFYDDRTAAWVSAFVIVILLAVAGLLAWLTVGLRPALAGPLGRRPRPAAAARHRRRGRGGGPEPAAPPLVRRAPAPGAGRRPPAGLARPGMAAERSPHGNADRRHPRGQDRPPGGGDPARRRPPLSGLRRRPRPPGRSPCGTRPRSRPPCRERRSGRRCAPGTPWGRGRRPAGWPPAAPRAGRRCSR